MEAIKLNLYAPFLRVLLIVAGVLSAAVLSLFVFAAPAHADGGIGGGGGGDIDVGVGGGGSAPPTSGIGTDVPNTPKPSGGATSQQKPQVGNNYALGCANWSGAGSWQPGASCNSERAHTIAGGPASSAGRKESWGSSTVYSGIKFTTYVQDNQCAPSGQKSAYGQNWRQLVADYVEHPYYYKWNRNFGWVKFEQPPVLMGQYISYYQFGCLYPTDQRSSTTCFWNYGGNAKYSIDRTRPQSAWSAYGNRPALASDPRQPTGGSGTTPPSCDRTGTANVYYKTKTNPFGYYKMFTSYSYKTYNNLKWIAWGNQVVYSQWSSGGTQPGSATTYWTHSCRPGAANATEGPYNSQGALPNIDKFTNPATCPQVQWQCKLGTPTTFGLDRAAVTSGRLSPTTPAAAMRNGERVNLDFANVRIVDTSTARDVDVTDGGSSNGVKDVTNIAYKTEVKGGSTPFYGTDANASIQYFKYFANRSNASIEKFGQWYNNNNANGNKAMSFNWASESASQGFVVERTYRVTASFNTPQGGDMGNGAASAPQGSSWKVGTYDCRDYQGRGANRVDKGILTSSSNPLNVVRATNK